MAAINKTSPLKKIMRGLGCDRCEEVDYAPSLAGDAGGGSKHSSRDGSRSSTPDMNPDLISAVMEEIKFFFTAVAEKEKEKRDAEDKAGKRGPTYGWLATPRSYVFPAEDEERFETRINAFNTRQCEKTIKILNEKAPEGVTIAQYVQMVDEILDEVVLDATLYPTPAKPAGIANIP